MEGELPANTILCCSTESKLQANIEVLNVNNVDSTGGVVLNDEKLLELVQLYPFLYNPRVRPFQDIDYDEWAWNRITSAFNLNYEGLLPPVTFDKNDLQRRWEKLQPIIQKMAKMLDLTAIPEPLRQMIVKISVQLEDQITDVRINLRTDAQQIIYDNMAMVEQLPLDKRLQLEAEMMDLILNSELDTKATIKLNEWTSASVYEEYEELLKEMDIKELILLKSSDDTITMATKDSSQEHIVTSTTSNGSYEININGDSNSDEGYDIDFEEAMGNNASHIYKTKKEIPKSNMVTWIPSKNASKHIRRCLVRLKRINLEDYLPLSQMKRHRRISSRL